MSRHLSRLLAMLLAAVLLLCALPAGAQELFTQEMIERSYVASGDTTRLRRAIDKAKNGEEVSIVYLGGSITEGSNTSPRTTGCYAYLSAQKFAE